MRVRVSVRARVRVRVRVRVRARVPARQQQAAPRELRQGEAAAVPRVRLLVVVQQLQRRAHHVVGELKRQTAGDAAHTLGRRPAHDLG